MQRIAHIDIQTKIILLLISVIVPTFLLVTLIQNKVTQPILEQEMLQVGLATAESLQFKILSNKWLSHPNSAIQPSSVIQIESEIQELIYTQPSILRIDIYVKEPANELWRVVASNIEGESGVLVTNLPSLEGVHSAFKTEEDMHFWEIYMPIRLGGGANLKLSHKPIGVVHLLVSTKTVSRVLDTFWRITWVGAGISVVILVLVLSFFLRRAVQNEKLLRQAETQNVQLSEQLHATERELMNMEKLAVIGQLTANFAHEIGTPLNAVGGHMQLLKEEVRGDGMPKRTPERIEIISGELLRIENIVKGFLQTTAKPVSQRQLVDVNRILEATLNMIRPRTEKYRIEVSLSLDRKLGPLRMVPTDLEQIFINLLNNAIDSLQMKRRGNDRTRLKLKILTQSTRSSGQEWAQVCIYDTGVGISKADLKNVMKPFFTTKRPGEGTGLGLNISRELAMKYGGVIEMDSKEGAWAEIKLRFAYGMNA